jgi:hypothetical protein
MQRTFTATSSRPDTKHAATPVLQRLHTEYARLTQGTTQNATCLQKNAEIIAGLIATPSPKIDNKQHIAVLIPRQ